MSASWNVGVFRGAQIKVLVVMLLGLIEIKELPFGGEVGLMYAGARLVEKTDLP